MCVTVISSETAKSLERPVTRLASFSAASMASAPELRKYTASIDEGKVAQSATGLNLDVLQELPYHGVEMLVHLGFQRPLNVRMAMAKFDTQMPLMASKKALPSFNSIQGPCM